MGLFGSTQNIIQSNEVPDWLLPYFQDQADSQGELMRVAQRIYQDNAGYNAYPGERLQPFTTDQLTAMEMTRQNAGLGGGPALGQQQVSDAVARAGEATRDYGTEYSPTMVGSDQVGSRYSPARTSITQQRAARDVSAPSVGTRGALINPLDRVENDRFDAGDAATYLNPYREQVVDRTIAKMEESNDRRRLADQTRATAAGAYGGSRHGVLDTLREEEFGETLGETVSQLYDAGFGQAREQFNADAGRGVDVGRFNVGADLDRRGRNAQTEMQARLANQDAGLKAGVANQASDIQRYGDDQEASNAINQFDASLGLDAFRATAAIGESDANRRLAADQSNQQTGLQAFNANREQFNIDQGRLLDSARVSAGLGDQAQGMGLRDVASVMSVGDMGQQLGQQGLDLGVNDFQRQQSYPYQQFGWLQGALSGSPVENPSMFSTQTTQQPGPSPFSQVLGAGLTAAGIYGQFFK